MIETPIREQKIKYVVVKEIDTAHCIFCNWRHLGLVRNKELGAPGYDPIGQSCMMNMRVVNALNDICHVRPEIAAEAVRQFACAEKPLGNGGAQDDRSWSTRAARRKRILSISFIGASLGRIMHHLE